MGDLDRDYHARMTDALNVIVTARKEWFDSLMEAEDVETLFLETLREIEYALFPYHAPETKKEVA